MGPLIPLVWTSGDFCPGFQSQGGSLDMHASSPVHNKLFRLISGATPADLRSTSLHTVKSYFFDKK